MKKVWITSVISSTEAIKKVMSVLKTYGLNGNGHYWKNDLKKFLWIEPLSEVLDTNTCLWGILGNHADFSNQEIRYGLSLLAITVQAKKGYSFPIIILQNDNALISNSNLPTPLKGAFVMSAADPGLGAKLVAKAHSPAAKVSSEYYIDIHGNEQIGQWFEVGPSETTWKGVIFGVSAADITFHGVGARGNLPQESELNYQQKGMKLTLGEKEYTSWAVQNVIDSHTSYYVKIEGFPESVVFGAYPDDNEAELFMVKLK